jgi:hypothetical protein
LLQTDQYSCSTYWTSNLTQQASRRLDQAQKKRRQRLLKVVL